MSNYLNELLVWVRLGMLAMFGGAASYVYLMVKNNTPFRWFTFIANLFLAFFVGKTFGGFIPETTSNYTGWVMMLGFCGYPVLGLAEEKFMAYLATRITPGDKP